MTNANLQIQLHKNTKHKNKTQKHTYKYTNIHKYEYKVPGNPDSRRELQWVRGISKWVTLTERLRRAIVHIAPN